MTGEGEWLMRYGVDEGGNIECIVMILAQRISHINELHDLLIIIVKLCSSFLPFFLSLVCHIGYNVLSLLSIYSFNGVPLIVAVSLIGFFQSVER